MKYVLDTNTISFLMSGEVSVTRALLAHARTDVLLPGPAIAEIAYGLARLPPSKRRDRLAARFELVSSQMPRVPWTDEVSQAFGDIKADLERRGVLIEDFDVAIAAHAKAIGATLVTDNLDHMGRVAGLEIENWLRREAD